MERTATDLTGSRERASKVRSRESGATKVPRGIRYRPFHACPMRSNKKALGEDKVSRLLVEEPAPAICYPFDANRFPSRIQRGRVGVEVTFGLTGDGPRFLAPALKETLPCSIGVLGV